MKAGIRLFPVFFLFLAVACKKPAPAIVPVIPAGISAKFNGTLWSASNTYAYIDSANTNFGTLLSIHGFDTASTVPFRQMTLGFLYFKYKTGNYDASRNANSSVSYCVDGVCSVSYSGSITITAISTQNVQGTFTALTDSASITDGKFNVAILP